MLHKIDSFIRNAKTQTLLFLALFLLTTVAIFILNAFYPTFCDDWTYTFICGQNEALRIGSFQDLVISQYTHYQIWGGRTIAHSIAQLLLCLSPMVQDILNTLVFMFFLYMLYIISNQRLKLNFFLLAFIIGLLWIFSDTMFFVSTIWITGSCNYLWTASILLIFLYPYIKLYQFDKTSESKLQIFLISFVGFVAGWCNENSSFAVILAAIALVILLKSEKRKIPTWCFWGIAFCILGYILLIIAPGNYARMSTELSHLDTPVADKTYIELATERIELLFHTLKVTHTLILSGMFALVTIIYLYFNNNWKRNTDKRRALYLALILFAAGIASACVMMAMHEIAYRTIFFTNFIIVVSIAILVRHLIEKNNFMYYSILCLSIGLMGLTAFNYYKKAYTMQQVSNLWTERETQVEAEKEKGNMDIVLDRTFDVHPKYFIYDIDKEPLSHYNKYYSMYLGIHSIRLASDAQEISIP